MNVIDPSDASEGDLIGADAARVGPRRKLLVAGAVGAGLLAAVYVAIAMPGMDHGGDAAGEPAAMEHGAADGMSLDAEAFAARLAVGDAVVINVHTPYEGEIGGTGLFVPYDEIAGDPGLPDRKDAEILLYCKTGRMSAIAAETLMGLGYTNVADLEGGMRAWEADGRPIASR